MTLGNSYPDPGVEFGSFKVLPRTDGGYIIVDVRRKSGHRTVGRKFKTLDEATRTAEEWHKAGHG